jgi:hypothetical protein
LVDRRLDFDAAFEEVAGTAERATEVEAAVFLDAVFLDAVFLDVVFLDVVFFLPRADVVLAFLDCFLGRLAAMKNTFVDG